MLTLLYNDHMKLRSSPLQNSIKQYRVLSDLTQEQLAAAADVSRQTIAAVEKGTYNPSVLLALRLAEVLHRQVEELFWTDGTLQAPGTGDKP
jgi:putative transcriptional regulator